MYLRNVGKLFNVLHDVISQKTELFMATAVRTSNLSRPCSQKSTMIPFFVVLRMQFGRA
jgi:hypothetical protein